MNGRPAPLLEEFAVAESDRAEVEDIVARVTRVLEESDATRSSVILAALAELSARFMRTPPQVRKVSKRGAAS
jgi:hypothetical protein